MRQPQSMERQQSDSTLFLYADYLTNSLLSWEFLSNQTNRMPTFFIIVCVALFIFEIGRVIYSNQNKVNKSDYENLQHQLRLAQEEKMRILSNTIEQDKRVSSGVDILKQLEEMRGVKLEKDYNYQKDDCELYNLSYYDIEGFLCYAGVNDDMIIMQSPIVDMVPCESEDVYMKVLHFCQDFTHNYRGIEKLKCYLVNYKYPDDEEERQYVAIYMEYCMIGISQTGLEHILQSVRPMYTSVHENILHFVEEEFGLKYGVPMKDTIHMYEVTDQISDDYLNNNISI